MKKIPNFKLKLTDGSIFKSLETNSSTTSSLLDKKSQEKKIKNKI